MNDKQDSKTRNQLILYKPPEGIIASPAAASFDERSTGLHPDTPLAAYWYVVQKRRWTIIGAAALLTVIAAALSFTMTPVYEAIARLEIEPEAPQLKASSDVYERVDADDLFLKTQIQVLKSDNLAWQTIEQLKLADHFGGVPATDPADPVYEKRKLQLINAFKSHLKVDQLANTRMLSVSFDDPDPQWAARAATGLVNTYLEYNFREKDEAIRRSGWMEQQVEALRAKVEASQQALVRYEQNNQIVSFGGKENVLEQMLADQSHDLTSAQSDRIQKESLYRQVLANPDKMASWVHDELLEKLEEEAADLKQRYTETIAQYGPNFPKAKRIRLQIEESQDQITGERERIINRISSDFQAAYRRERLAAASVAQQKAAVGRLNQLLVQENILRHEFQTNQQLYESLLQHLKDATVSAALRSTNIHLVDSALPPTSSVRPRKQLNIVAAFWAGLIVGVMIAFAQEAMDSSVKTAEEAESLLLAPAIGIIPFERRTWRTAIVRYKRKRDNPIPLTLTAYPNSPLSEAFRALGTAVSVPSRPIKTLLVTSSQNGDGKTTTAVNLAQALAQRKLQVLLVDCDLRKGDVARFVGIEKRTGLSGVVSGETNITDALHAVEPNLWVLPAGDAPANPVSMLASREMRILLQRLVATFQFVIIDSPPVLAVTDAALLASSVDGVLLVAASGATSRGGLVRTHRILEASGGKILGIAVNKLDPRQPSYGYPYSRYAYK
jgi:polysaccharide biosynthesis transport protein